MSKLGRVLQRIFGINATTGGVGVGQLSRIGSFAAGSSTTENPTDAGALDMQSLPNYLGGWYSCIVGGNSPVAEDMNSLHFLVTRQLAYLFQEGIPEWDSTTTYFLGSIVNVSGVLYVCVSDNSGAGQAGNATTNATYWAPLVSSGGNLVLNGAFDFWQRGTSATNNYSATPGFVYLPDRWALVNVSGSGAVLTGTQVAGSIAGSKYGFSSKISTAPGTPTAVGAQVAHVLGVNESAKLYNKAASFSVNVKALGNVTTVGIQLFYATAAQIAAGTVGSNLLGQLIGSVNNFTVNSSGFVNCSFTQAVGTAMGTGGAIGVLISTGLVSSGHASDLNNGFVLEQASMNVGIPQAFSRAYNSDALEFAACMEYCEDTNGTGAVSNQFSGNVTSGSAYLSLGSFKTPKRVDVSGGLAFQCTNVGTPANFSSTASTTTSISKYGYVTTRTASGTGVGSYSDTFIADAEIY